MDKKRDVHKRVVRQALESRVESESINIHSRKGS